MLVVVVVGVGYENWRKANYWEECWGSTDSSWLTTTSDAGVGVQLAAAVVVELGGKFVDHRNQLLPCRWPAAVVELGDNGGESGPSVMVTDYCYDYDYSPTRRTTRPWWRSPHRPCHRPVETSCLHRLQHAHQHR